jgi:hypothetical protein
MDNIWFQSAVWMALALLAAMGDFIHKLSGFIRDCYRRDRGQHSWAASGAQDQLRRRLWCDCPNVSRGDRNRSSCREKKYLVKRVNWADGVLCALSRLLALGPGTASAGRGRKRRLPASPFQRHRWRSSMQLWSRLVTIVPNSARSSWQLASQRHWDRTGTRNCICQLQHIFGPICCRYRDIALDRALVVRANRSTCERA